MSRVSLERDFVDHVLKGGFFAEGDRVLVAVSGGLDSLVLLHLLRFASGLPDLHLVVGHFDHRMRDSSDRDAEWVRGWCLAWGIEYREGSTETPLRSEEDARQARYVFLEDELRESGARWVVTGHHADDQVETVLFRIARGTGLRGLAGIPEQRAPGILRPLLPFSKNRLAEYARAAGIEPRFDPTNTDRTFARNAIRNEVLPLLEESVAEGVRASLLRLARIAGQEERAWQSIAGKLMADLTVESGDTRVVLDRTEWLEYDPEVQARLLRILSERFGARLDEAGTRAAVSFASVGTSGKEHWLTDTLRARRAFDHIVVELVTDSVADGWIEIEGPEEGSGGLMVGGRDWIARWSVTDSAQGAWVERFTLADLAFPVRMRGWNAGDRVRYSYGSKKLKKVFGESRVPMSERSRVPVVVDGAGRVLWVPGLARSSLVVPGPSDRALAISLFASEETA